ncbi:fibronectin type III domain-containing protein [Micromonospora sp. AKA38]|uniref:fibronectin type III domain-containing protein n=1 Tax=Micromonospora sp. AKA38 TaxID=2733861 RepID=UPI0024917D22|nr:fibronectin type III domain-containing protein [Micromonospora sp. AKA38]
MLRWTAPIVSSAYARHAGVTAGRAPIPGRAMVLFRRLRPDRPDRAATVAEETAPTVPTARAADETPAGPAERTGPAPLDPGGVPRLFGPVPNTAGSPLPTLDPDGRPVPGTGLRKFVDPLPLPGRAPTAGLGARLPVAVPDTITWPGCDYYEIGLQEYAQRLHRDLPATRLRGYRQLNLGTDASGHNTVSPPDRPWHLGPMIEARRGRPVRIKFINQLPTGRAGELFLPVDETVDGAGTGPLDGPAPYPQNRAVPHLAGARTAWISAGNPWQWVTPAGEITPYPVGVGVTPVPDMPAPGAGATTLYFPNDQSGRLMWLHDNTLGLSRLTVYAGQLALYLLTDPAEDRLVADGVLPADQLPLVIEDKTFVPDDAQLAAQDPTWDRDRWGAKGSLWHPHVYQPRQNPYRISGTNPTGRWDYGPWAHDPDGGTSPWVAPVPNPHHDPVTEPDEPPLVPGVPHPSAVPAAYGDTPLVNGVAYPYLEVEPRAYRFRILNACADRALNLQLYRAASDGPMWTPDGDAADPRAGEVPMVEAVRVPGRAAYWPVDGRDGGVPDPAAAGPELIQIGNEGGLLPAPVVLANQPVGYRYDRQDPTVLNVDGHTLLLAPGERADVVVDFSTVPPGRTLILYNDCPAPLPRFDPRYDHHTGAADRTGAGGLPPAHPGYGPNTRTLLQIRVVGSPAPRYDMRRLAARLPAAYAQSQPPPIVPQPAYDPAFGTRTAGPTLVPARATSVTFTPAGGSGPVTLPLAVKSVGQVFEPRHGRAVGRLGVGHPLAGPLAPAVLPLGPADPVTEELFVTDPTVPVGAPADGTQLWRIVGDTDRTHPVHVEGVDVQVVNRVGWDGTLRPPEQGELGWKDTVRVNPREDVVVALRPVAPSLPFTVGDSVRLLDPSRPAGARLDAGPVSPVDGRPATVVNQVVNLGWEYRWQTRSAGLRDQGMSRPLVLRVSPRAPTGLTATPVPGSATALPAIALAWTGNGSRPPATSHRLQRATDSAFTTGRTEITVAATATRYTDATVTPGVTYHYRIRAENAVSCSAWSNDAPAAVRLTAPSRLTAAVPPAAPLRVALRWANHSFATGVDVQRATNPTFTSGPGTTAITVGEAHLDPVVAPDTTYYYRVRTTYLGAASPWSTVATVTTPPRPAAPTRVSATAGAPAPDTTTVTLSWSASTPVGPGAGFLVERATDAGFTRDPTTFRVTGRGFTNTALPPGVTYYYRVRATNIVGTSPWTPPIQITTPE